MTGAAATTLATGAAAAAGVSAADSEPAVADTEQMSERQLSISDGEDLSSYVSDSSNGELLVVPSGSYEWNRRVSFSRRNWGIRGEGDVEIAVPASRGRGTKNGYVLNVSGDNVFVENLTFDSDGRPAIGFRCIVDQRAEFRDITVASDGPRTWNAKQTNMFNVGAESSSGEVLLDGIVAYNNGNISQYNGGSSRVGIWSSRSGKLTVRNSVVSGFPNNGIYTRMPGALEVDNCVFANNNVSSIRLGGSNEVVKNSTFYLDLSRDDTTHSHPQRGVSNTGGITADNRERASNGGYVRNCSFIVENVPNSTGAIRFLENEWVEVEDSQFLLNQSDVPGVGWNNSGSARLRNLVFDTENGSGAAAASQGGQYPTVEDVCVSSDLSDGAIDASSRNCSFDWSQAHDYPNPDFEGGTETTGNGTDEPRLGNTLVIDGEGGSERADYQFAVDGAIEHSEYYSAYGTGGEIDGGSATGFVRGGADGFRFSGELTNLQIDDGPTVRVNGIEVDPDDIGEEDSGNGDSGLERTIAIDGDGGSERVTYRFTVDGEVERSEELSAYGTGGDIDGNSVSGFVRGGTDGFQFSGELTELEVDGEPIVRVDGAVVEPAEIVSSDAGQELVNTLVIDGEGSSERVDYQFAVDGAIEHSEYYSAYGTGGEIDDGSVTGFVRGGADGFRFSGELTDLQIDDGPTVRVNGVEVDPSRLWD
ncbi:hypothetical protein C488_01484 [Natrinema pellirubrum DSM 15624]|uniref:Right handed beta helix domain-containing protein n=1 Tax=Natrinema pellirubrum (strain DSM 15624 / CIP 106293 / JCM 10476 / NCIMB 786 / 157) TaxID=797303 RepID=L9Z4X8_NATP1|nr:right-handed parallel beta-helix repeat-containing protein [Natrinema pellirubrum]ELY81439.1 hypothetical protein C488_01484 [Natrinema pellirubrum DSM 15624]